MRDRIKACWAHRPRLSRGWRIVRNLAVALLLIFGYWFLCGCRPLTTEGALRRLERTQLVEPGVTLCREPDNQRPGKELAFVLGDNYAYVAETWRSLTFPYASLEWGARLDEGPVLLPMGTSGLPGPRSGLRWEGILFCPRGPEGGVRAELALTCRCTWEIRALEGNKWELRRSDTSAEEFQGSAERDERGVYRFSVQAGNEDGARALQELLGGQADERIGDGFQQRKCVLDGAEYRIDFYGADGALADSVLGVLDL